MSALCLVIPILLIELGTSAAYAPMVHTCIVACIHIHHAMLPIGHFVHFIRSWKYRYITMV